MVYFIQIKVDKMYTIKNLKTSNIVFRSFNYQKVLDYLVKHYQYDNMYRIYMNNICIK
jgi:hypothetical protein